MNHTVIETIGVEAAAPARGRTLASQFDGHDPELTQLLNPPKTAIRDAVDSDDPNPHALRGAMQEQRDHPLGDRDYRVGDRSSASKKASMTNSAKTSDRALAGSCLCRAVEYTVADEFRYAANCHCSSCRRTTGSAFKPFAGIERSKFGVTKGEQNLMTFGDENAHDAHCKSCGSLLYSIVREGAFVHVAMGTLADDPSIRPTAHIFVASKAPWFTITDDLPQYDEHE